MQFSLSKTSSLSDLELVERYKASGKIALVTELFSRYSHLIFCVCLKYLKNQEDSKDATMQIFEIIQQKLLEHDISNPGGWIHITTKNHCLMQLRAQKVTDENQNKLIADMEFVLSAHHTNEHEAEPDIFILNSCLDKLGKEQQKCIKLFYLDGKCYKQVANLTGYELKKVKSYLQNGKRNLKACIEENREK